MEKNKITKAKFPHQSHATNSYVTMTACHLPDGGGENKHEGNTEAAEQMGQTDNIQP